MFSRARMVTVDIGAQLIAHVSNVYRCGSVWCCPLCAPVVRERRAIEIDLAASMALVQGQGVEMVSMTSRHSRPDPLADRLAPMARCFAECLQGRTWARLKKELGYVGLIRAVEVTWSATNGWHPHVHALLFFERPLTRGQRVALQEFLFRRWSAYLERKKLGAITRKHGVDVRQVRGATSIANYLTKIEGGWSAGLELTRSDLKKSPGSMTPWEMLVDMYETGEATYKRQWVEYENTTRGKRAIVWSRGLRGRLLGQEATESDEELAAAEGADVTLVRLLIASHRWDELVRLGLDGDMLSECERIAEGLIYGAEQALDPENPYTMELHFDDTRI